MVSDETLLKGWAVWFLQRGWITGAIYVNASIRTAVLRDRKCFNQAVCGETEGSSLQTQKTGVTEAFIAFKGIFDIKIHLYSFEGSVLQTIIVEPLNLWTEDWVNFVKIPTQIDKFPNWLPLDSDHDASNGFKWTFIRNGLDLRTKFSVERTR